jgi:hypothetical protein
MQVALIARDRELNGSPDICLKSQDPASFPPSRLSRYCHSSRGKMLENGEQKLNTEEKLTLALHRNCLILLGKLPLRQIVIKLLKWRLT